MPLGGKLRSPITVRLGEPIEPASVLAEGETGYEAYRRVAAAVRQAVDRLAH